MLEYVEKVKLKGNLSEKQFKDELRVSKLSEILNLLIDKNYYKEADLI